MNNKRKGDGSTKEEYFAEAQAWEVTADLARQNSSRRNGIFAIISLCVAAVAVASTALIALHPPAPPVVLRVDNATGIVDVVTTVKDAKSNYDETVNKYFVGLYLRYREGYSRQVAEEYYYATGLMSETAEQTRYGEIFNPKNPKSPLNVYGEFATARISIKSISLIKDNVALARYTKSVLRGTAKPEVTHWAATVAFSYNSLPMKESDRAISPLGFRVTEYRNDPDVPGKDATYVEPGVPAVE